MDNTIMGQEPENASSATGGSEIPHLNLKNAELLVQLHIAEYQALTTRCTYWITLQFFLWPSLIVYLTLIAQVWNYIDTSILIWSSVAVLQIVTMVWAGLMGEGYNAIRYIEHELRPMVQQLVGNIRFWYYELYLARQRGRGPMLFEYPYPLLALISILICVYIRWPLSQRDYYGIVINGIFFVVIILQTRHAIRIRLDFFSGIET